MFVKHLFDFGCFDPVEIHHIFFVEGHQAIHNVFGKGFNSHLFQRQWCAHFAALKVTHRTAMIYTDKTIGLVFPDNCFSFTMVKPAVPLRHIEPNQCYFPIIGN